MIGENPIKTNKAKAEDQIIIYYATNAAAARCGASVAPYAPGYSWWATNNTSIQITSFIGWNTILTCIISASPELTNRVLIGCLLSHWLPTLLGKYFYIDLICAWGLVDYK